MNGPRNFYGLPVALSLISKNKFIGGVFDSLIWITINTNHNAFNDGTYIYIPVLSAPLGGDLEWAVLKIRLSDLSFQLFMSYNCVFPFFNGQFNYSDNSIFRGDESFYFSPPSIAGWGGIPRYQPFIVSTKVAFTPNQIIRMNTLFITDSNVYPCVGESSSFGVGILSDGKTCLELTSEEYGPMYTRAFALNDALAQTINHGMSNVIGGAVTFLPAYLNIPMPYAHWAVGKLNGNLIWQNSNYELCAQITDQSTYTYYMNFGVPVINALPSKCSSLTFSSVDIRSQQGFSRFNGDWPVTGKSVNMYNPAPDLGLRGFTCCIGFYDNMHCLFVSKNGYILPLIVDDLDVPCYVAYSKQGLIVIGQGNIMLYNLNTLDFNIYTYFPTKIEKVGVALTNLSRPVSPLGAFRT